MMTTDTRAQTKTKKLTKVDRLKLELEVAKAALAKEEPGLVAELSKATADLRALRKAYDDAEKAAGGAYAALKMARQEEAVNLGLVAKTGNPSEKLLASLKVFVVAAGFPDANLESLARSVIDRDVSALARVVELKSASASASAKKDRTYRTWNLASCPTGEVARLTKKLEAVRERVSVLEEEIGKVPARNEQARDRREDVRREASEFLQTDRARALLPSFTFASADEASKTGQES
jgi:hypothetical protein